jgi:hypothetical protein
MLHVTRNWSIRLRSFEPSHTICVRKWSYLLRFFFGEARLLWFIRLCIPKFSGDVIAAVFKALNSPIDGDESVADDPERGTRIRTHDHQDRYNSLEGKFLWVGLKREYVEHVNGVPVCLQEDGEVDGGRWWLVLRRP